MLICFPGDGVPEGGTETTSGLLHIGQLLRLMLSVLQMNSLFLTLKATFQYIFDETCVHIFVAVHYLPSFLPSTLHNCTGTEDE